MCARSKKFSGSSFCGVARPLAFVLLFFLVASPLLAADWAFLRKSEKATPVDSLQVEVVETEQESSPEVQVSQEASQPSQTGSESYSEAQKTELTERLNSLAAALNNSLVVTNSLKQSFSDFKTQYETSKSLEDAEDAVHKEAVNQLAQYEAENRILADKVAKAEATKRFTKLNALMGFSDGEPVYGAGLSLGLKFKSGVLVEFGGNYMFGSNPLDPKFDFKKDNMLFNASLGFEW